MKKIKIGVADDNQDFCDVVRDYVKKQDNMRSFLRHPME